MIQPNKKDNVESHYWYNNLDLSHQQGLAQLQYKSQFFESQGLNLLSGSIKFMIGGNLVVLKIYEYIFFKAYSSITVCIDYSHGTSAHAHEASAHKV